MYDNQRDERDHGVDSRVEENQGRSGRQHLRAECESNRIPNGDRNV